MLLGGTIDRAYAESAARFHSIFHVLDRSASKEDKKEAFIQLSPGESLKKLVEFKISVGKTREPKLQDVVVMLSLKEELYTHLDRGHADLLGEPAPRTWTGTVTSNWVEIEVVGEKTR